MIYCFFNAFFGGHSDSIQSSASIHLYIDFTVQYVLRVFKERTAEEEDTYMFRPCIDLHEGEVKQIVGASLTKSKIETNFKSERPSTYFAEMYKVCSIRIRNRENVKLYTHQRQHEICGSSHLCHKCKTLYAPRRKMS